MKQSSLFGFIKRKSTTNISSKNKSDPSLKKRKIRAEDERFNTYENVKLPKGYYAVRNSLITNDLDHMLSIDVNAKSTKLASFDFDNTLANRTFGKELVLPRDLTHPAIPYHLMKLHNNGYRIVIFTNEATIGNRKKKETIKSAIDTKIRSLEKFLSYMRQVTSYDRDTKRFVLKKQAPLGSDKQNADSTSNCNNGLDHSNDTVFPIYILIATRKDFYRKPNTKDIAKDKSSGGIGMWHYLCKIGSYESHTPSIEDSVFVGDAAGRPSDYRQSDGDLKFAERLGMKFFNEVDFWTNDKVSLYTGVKFKDDYENNNLIIAAAHQHRKRPDIVWKEKNNAKTQTAYFNDSSQLVLILHGLPGSGKSTFANKFIHNKCSNSSNDRWVVVCQDELKSREKCEKIFKQSLYQKNVNIIVDRTNISIEQRKVWIKLAARYKALCVLVDFDSYNIPQLVERCMNRIHVGNLDGRAHSGDKIKKIIKRLEATYQEPNCTNEGLFSIVHCKNDTVSNEYAEKILGGYIPVLVDDVGPTFRSQQDNKNVIKNIEGKMMMGSNIMNNSKNTLLKLQDDAVAVEKQRVNDKEGEDFEKNRIQRDQIIFDALKNKNMTPEELINACIQK
jgi:DNA 3'-phosphatase